MPSYNPDEQDQNQPVKPAFRPPANPAASLGVSTRGNRDAASTSAPYSGPRLDDITGRATQQDRAQARQQRQDDADYESAIERSNDAAAIAANAKRKEDLARKEAEFRTQGVKFYTDATGDLVPERDERGQVRFNEDDLGFHKDAKSGTWARLRRGPDGRTTATPAKARRSKEDTDPYLYADLGEKGPQDERIGHADELAKISDEDAKRSPHLAQIRDLARANIADRTKIARSQALAPILETKRALDEQEATARLRMGELEQSATAVLEEINRLDSDPAIKETTGGFLGMGAKPTDRALQLQTARAEAQRRLEALTGEQSTLQASLSPEGELGTKKARVTAELDLAKAQQDGPDIAADIERRKTWLQTQGKDEDSDEYLQRLYQAEEKIGATLSTEGQLRKQARAEARAEAKRVKEAIGTPEGIAARSKAIGDAARAHQEDADDFDAQAESLNKELKALESNPTSVTPEKRAELKGRVANLTIRQARMNARAHILMGASQAVTAESEAKNQAFLERGAQIGKEMETTDRRVDRQIGFSAAAAMPAGVRPAPDKLGVGRPSQINRSPLKPGTDDYNAAAAYAFAQAKDRGEIAMEGKRMLEALGTPDAKTLPFVGFPGGGIELHPDLVSGFKKDVPDIETVMRKAASDGFIRQESVKPLVAEYQMQRFANEERTIDEVIWNHRDALRNYAAAKNIQIPQVVPAQMGASRGSGDLPKGAIRSDDKSALLTNMELRNAARQFLQSDDRQALTYVQDAIQAVVGIPFRLGADLATAGGELTGLDSLRDFGIDVRKMFGTRADIRDIGTKYDTIISGISSAGEFLVPASLSAKGAKALTASMSAARAAQVETLAARFPTAAKLIAGSEAAASKQAASILAGAAARGTTIATGAVMTQAQMFTEMREMGIDPTAKQQWAVVAASIPLGASELLPIERLVKGISNGAIRTKIRGSVAKALIRGGRQFLADTAEETMQEMGQEILTDLAAKAIYDARRQVGENIWDAALGGAAGGAFMSAVATAIGGARFRSTLQRQNRQMLRLETEGAVLDQIDAEWSNPASTMQLMERLRESGLPVTSGEEIHRARSFMAGAQTTRATQAAREAFTQAQAALEAVQANPNSTGTEELQARQQVLVARHVLTQAQAASVTHNTFALAALREIDSMPEASGRLMPRGTLPANVAAITDQNRNAARALLRIALGSATTPETFTEAETLALQNVGARMGTSMVRYEEGQPVITDTARAWMQEVAPQAAAAIRQSEVERLTQIQAQATDSAPTQVEGDRAAPDATGREAGPSPAPAAAQETPAEQPDAKVLGQMAYTDDLGVERSMDVPAGATLSTGEPVRTRTQAEEWVAENVERGMVRNMKWQPAPKPAAAPAAPSTAPKQAATTTTALPKRTDPTYRQPITDAKQGVAAIKAQANIYSSILGEVDTVNDSTSRMPVGVDSKTGRMFINSAEIAQEIANGSLTPERVENLVRHEAIHAVALKLENDGKLAPAGLFRALAPATQQAIRDAYGKGRAVTEAYLRNDRSMGHEGIRMFVEGRLTIARDGKLTLDGAAISDEVVPPTLRKRLADVFRRIRDYLANFRDELLKDGNKPEVVDQLNSTIDLIAERIAAVEGTTLPGQSQPAATGTTATQTTRTNEIQGQGQEGQGTALLNQQPQPATSSPAPAPAQTAPAAPVAGRAADTVEVPAPSGDQVGVAISYDRTTGTLTPESRTAVAAAYTNGNAAAVGRAEKVIHKGKQATVVYAVRELEELRPSNRPDGTVNTDYPADYQPRNRQDAAYIAQQRRMAQNWNMEEFALSGTTDRGTPILAQDPATGRPFTMIGNGRAISLQMVLTEQDFAASRERYMGALPDLAQAKGIDPATLSQFRNPVLVRVIASPLTPDELREISRESNEFAGQQTNAVEQAAVDADRLKLDTLAFFDREYALDAQQNLEFRQRALEDIVGRNANLTPAEGKRRIELAIFLKAYANNPAGKAAFQRLVEEKDEGVSAIQAGLMEAAPNFLTFRDSVQRGDLHPVDASDEIAQAVQDIVTAIANKPKAESINDALEKLLQQPGMEAILGPREAADIILQAFIRRRRSSQRIADYVNAYVAAAYARGNPNQGDMFGDMDPPTKVQLANGADMATTPKGEALGAAPAAPARIPNTERPTNLPERFVQLGGFGIFNQFNGQWATFADLGKTDLDLHDNHWRTTDYKTARKQAEELTIDDASSWRVAQFPTFWGSYNYGEVARIPRTPADRAQAPQTPAPITPASPTTRRRYTGPFVTLAEGWYRVPHQYRPELPADRQGIGLMDEVSRLWLSSADVYGPNNAPTAATWHTSDRSGILRELQQARRNNPNGRIIPVLFPAMDGDLQVEEPGPYKPATMQIYPARPELEAEAARAAAPASKTPAPAAPQPAQAILTPRDPNAFFPYWNNTRNAGREIVTANGWAKTVRNRPMTDSAHAGWAIYDETNDEYVTNARMGKSGSTIWEDWAFRTDTLSQARESLTQLRELIADVEEEDRFTLSIVALPNAHTGNYPDDLDESVYGPTHPRADQPVIPPTAPEWILWLNRHRPDIARLAWFHTENARATHDADGLNTAFNWGRTPEGDAFWGTINAVVERQPDRRRASDIANLPIPTGGQTATPQTQSATAPAPTGWGSIPGTNAPAPVGRPIAVAAPAPKPAPAAPANTPEELARYERLGRFFTAVAANDELFQGPTPAKDPRLNSRNAAKIAEAYSTPEVTLEVTMRGPDNLQIEIKRKGGTGGISASVSSADKTPDGRNTVYVDAVNANSQGNADDGGGKLAYQLIFTWALNNGHAVEGNSLSRINQVRRTVNMLASSLRHKTTAHLIPNSSQDLIYKKWLGMTDIQRVGYMVETLSEGMSNRISSKLDRLTYDPVSDSVIDTRRGTTLTPTDLKGLVGAPEIMAYREGFGPGTVRVVLATRAQLLAFNRGDRLPSKAKNLGLARGLLKNVLAAAPAGPAQGTARSGSLPSAARVDASRVPSSERWLSQRQGELQEIRLTRGLTTPEAQELERIERQLGQVFFDFANTVSTEDIAAKTPTVSDMFPPAIPLGANNAEKVAAYQPSIEQLLLRFQDVENASQVAQQALVTAVRADADRPLEEVRAALIKARPPAFDAQATFQALLDELPDRPRDMIVRHAAGQGFDQIGAAYSMPANRAHQLTKSALGLIAARNKARNKDARGPARGAFTPDRSRPQQLTLLPDGAILTGQGTFDLGAAPIIAHHGTPHRIDRFSTAKIGTGEGAQAYGWGLYFAEERQVADAYRRNLAGNLLEFEGRGIRKTSDAPQQFVERAIESLRKNQAHAEFMAGMPRYVETLMKEALEGFAGDARRQVDTHESMKYHLTGMKARLRDLNIPDATFAKLDKAMTYVRDATSYRSGVYGDLMDRLELRINPVDRENLTRAESTAMAEISGSTYWLNPKKFTPEQALQLLKDDAQKTIDAQRSNYELARKMGSESEMTEALDRQARAEMQLALLNKGVLFIERIDGGNFYTVEIMADADEDMLHWDRDHRNQPPRVREAIKKMKAELNQDWQDEMFNATNAELDELTGEEVYRALVRYSSELSLPGAGPNEDGSDNKMEASAYLQRHGIKGIRYADGFSRSKPDQKTHNYVIFDDALVRILERNGEPVTQSNQGQVLAAAPAAPRSQPVSLPDAIIGSTLGTARNSKDYLDAKSGNLVAAIRITRELVTPDLLERIRAKIGDAKPIVLGVHAEEQWGRNRIPNVGAGRIAKELGLIEDTGIVQSNRPRRSNASALDRVFSRVEFDGPVQQGADYLLVDDTLTQGGTFADLADYIQRGGGKVVAVVALTGKQYSAKLRLSDELLRQLRAAFGNLEPQFTRATGYGFDRLTESEARALVAFRPADAVRDRILEEGQTGDESLGSRATGEGPLGAVPAGFSGPFYHGSPDFRGTAFNRRYLGRNTGLSRGGFSFTKDLAAAKGYSNVEVEPIQNALDEVNAVLAEVQREMEAGRLQVPGFETAEDLPEYNIQYLDQEDVPGWQVEVRDMARALPEPYASRLRDAVAADPTTPNRKVITAFLRNPTEIVIHGKKAWVVEDPADIYVPEWNALGAAPAPDARIDLTPYRQRNGSYRMDGLHRGIANAGPNDHGVAGKGPYFSFSERAARLYARPDGRVITGTITLRKPLILTYGQLNDLQTELFGKPLSGFEPELSDAMDQWMRDSGYDGAMLYDLEISTTVPEEVVKLRPFGMGATSASLQALRRWSSDYATFEAWNDQTLKTPGRVIAEAARKRPYNYRLELVPVASLRPSQQGEDALNDSSRETARRIAAGTVAQERPEDIAPIVLEEDGVSIRDGNHRHAAATINGDKEILALVPTGPGNGQIENLEQIHDLLTRRGTLGAAPSDDDSSLFDDQDSLKADSPRRQQMRIADQAAARVAAQQRALPVVDNLPSEEEQSVVEFASRPGRYRIPKFMGAKSAIAPKALHLLRRLFSQEQLDAVQTVVEGFGGSGSYGQILTLERFKKANKLVIVEFEAGRKEKIQYLHTRGDRWWQDYNRTGMRTVVENIVRENVQQQRSFFGANAVEDMELDPEGDVEKDPATSAGGVTGRMRNALTRSKTLAELINKYDTPQMRAENDGINIAEALAWSLIDYGSGDRASGLFGTNDQGKRRSAWAPEAFGNELEASDLYANLNRDIQAARRQHQLLEARGVKVEWIQGSAFDLIAAGRLPLGPSSFFVADPPYYHTTGYKNAGAFATGNLWNARGYAAVVEMLERAKATGTPILYNDEGWALNKSANDKDKKLPDRDQGERLWSRVTELFPSMFGSKVSDRLETIAIHNPTPIPDNGLGRLSGRDAGADAQPRKGKRSSQEAPAGVGRTLVRPQDPTDLERGVGQGDGGAGRSSQAPTPATAGSGGLTPPPPSTPAAPGSPEGADDAVRQDLDALAKDRGLDLAQVEAIYEQAALEPSGSQSSGNPELANPGTTRGVRRVVDSVDEYRRNRMERESHEMWTREAERILAADETAVLRDLLAQARSGVSGQTPLTIRIDNPALSPAAQAVAGSAVAVKAAQLLVDRLTRRAIDSNDQQAMRDAMTLAYAYRIQGTEQARALAARRDPFQTPEQRYREFLAGLIFTPSITIRNQVAKAWTPLEKAREINRLQAQVTATERQLEAAQVRANQATQAADLARTRANEAERAAAATPAPAPAPSADVSKLEQQLANLRNELGQARMRQSQQDMIVRASEQRLANLKRILAQTGVTVEDILGGEAVFQVRGAAVIGNVANTQNWDATRKRVAKLANAGWDLAEIIKRTGLTKAQVEQIHEQNRNDIKERLRRMSPAMLRKLTTSAGQTDLGALGAAPADENAAIPDAQRDEMIEQILRDMNMGDRLDNPMRSARTKRAKAQQNARKKAAKDVAPEKPADPNAVPPDPNDWLLTEDEDSMPPVFDKSDPAQVHELARIAAGMDSDGFDMAHEFWINSILSGPLTQAANISGNALNVAWSMGLKRALLATANDVVLRRPDLPHLAEFRHMLRAVIPSIATAWSNSAYSFATEQSRFAETILEPQTLLNFDGFDDRERRQATPDRVLGVGTYGGRSLPGAVVALLMGKGWTGVSVGKTVRLPGRFLMATDDFFKTVIAHLEAAAHAYRIAKSEGLSGQALERRIGGLVRLPGSAAWISAYETAQELTFQKDFAPTGGLGRIQQTAYAARRIPGVRYLIPFVRTPLNIFVQGIRQSPFGAIMLVGRYMQAGYLKARYGQEITTTLPTDEQASRAVEQFIAWSLAGLLYAAAAGDDDDEDKPLLITGALPDTSEAQRSLAQRAGMAPYSVRIAGKTVSYARLEPLATILGTTVDMVTGIKHGRKNLRSAPSSAMDALVQSITRQGENKTMLKGVADVFLMLKRANQQGITDASQEWVADFASSWVPNLLRQPARMLDDTVRAPAGTLGERIAQNIVPTTGAPSIDVYGREVKKGATAAWRLAIPVDVRDNPALQRVDRMLVNWNQKADPASELDSQRPWAPSKIQSTITVNGRRRRITAQEREAYARRAGAIASGLLQRVPLNVENPTEADVAKVKRAFEAARKTARREVFGATAAD